MQASRPLAVAVALLGALAVGHGFNASESVTTTVSLASCLKFGSDNSCCSEHSAGMLQLLAVCLWWEFQEFRRLCNDLCTLLGC